MDQSARLVALAAEYAPKRDLYEVLGVDAISNTNEIHRAWKRMGLKHHPDKTGDKFDPELYESLEHAHNILTDADARKKYDGLRSAHLQKQQELDAMSADRRRMINELEAAERAAKRQRTGQPDSGDEGGGPVLTAKERAEKERLRQEGLRKFEEFKRKRREAEEEEKRLEQEADAKRDAREAEIERILKEKAEKRAAKAKRKGEKRGVDTPADSGPELEKDMGAGTDLPTHTAPDPPPPAPAASPAEAEIGPRDPAISAEDAGSRKFVKVKLMVHQTTMDIQAAIKHGSADTSSTPDAGCLPKLENILRTMQEIDVYLFEALGQSIPPRLSKFHASWNSRTTGRGKASQVRLMIQQTADDIQTVSAEHEISSTSAETSAESKNCLAKLQKALGNVQKAEIYLFEALGEPIPSRLSKFDAEWKRSRLN